MPKKYLKTHERADLILAFLDDNPQSCARLIARCTGLGLSTVYKTIDQMGDALNKKRIRTSIHHRATVFSVSKSGTWKVVMGKADGKSNAPKLHPLMQHLYGQIA